MTDDYYISLKTRWDCLFVSWWDYFDNCIWRLRLILIDIILMLM